MVSVSKKVLQRSTLMSKWQLRWFVALWVFAGMMMGFGWGLEWSVRVDSSVLVVLGKSLFWIGLAVYLIVSGTLGRGYLKLIKSLD